MAVAIYSFRYVYPGICRYRNGNGRGARLLNMLLLLVRQCSSMPACAYSCLCIPEYPGTGYPRVLEHRALTQVTHTRLPGYPGIPDNR
eukprot:2005136-Rhodomonas_salina.1